jgi:copper chaperone CopZ
LERNDVNITYDDTKTTPQKISDALKHGGMPINGEPEFVE